MLENDAVWLITGCSKGLGRALAEQALARGYRVAVTARRTSDIVDLVSKYNKAAVAYELDVTDKEQIISTIKAVEARFGAVDVLVNNAGYAYLAALEEGEDEELRASFETNVFGPLNAIKAVLPGMRGRRRGHIVNLSSIGGIVTYPAAGHYHMAKFAIEAMSETLAKEVAPFGIDVTVVEPGAFRTEFRGQNSAKQSRTRIDDYADTAGKARDNIFAAHGKQIGDPARGAKAIIKAVEADQPPIHLVIGGDALDQFYQKLLDVKAELEKWESISRSTDFQN
jgi:NAD(P)-dependent dehydrogenase (short-subunit alcohol dehydrogenase family)